MNMKVNTIWYKEPWLWFMIILFIVSVVGAVAMSFIAVKNAPAEIGHHRFREGILSKREPLQDHLLKRINLKGALTMEAEGALNICLSHDNNSLSASELGLINPKYLRLYIEHPLYSQYDNQIRLSQDGNGCYKGKVKNALNGKYYLMLSPLEDQWYLTATDFFPSKQVVQLIPGTT